MLLLCQCIDERKDPSGPHASRKCKRSSDKGFLAMAEAEYLEILDWLARDKVARKRGSTPHSREFEPFALVAVKETFLFHLDWHQSASSNPLVRQYQVALDALLVTHCHFE